MSGMYSPSTGQLAIAISPSLSLGSSPSPGTAWSLAPSGSRSVTMAESRSTTAIAFASCTLTQAVVPSVVTYSGSRFADTGNSVFTVGPKTRTPSGSAAEPLSS